MLKAVAQRTRHLSPGDKLGKYEVIRQIAVGGMAELYLARTVGIEGFEKLVVLKRILPQYLSNASFVEMFLNEARLAATLHHANVAQVYDIGIDEGDYFFAMEYVHGEDLEHIAAASDEQGVPISLDAALTLVSGLCAALHYAHERVGADGRPLHIVHRDVSPSNVLVSYDGAVKLVDFGIARAASHPGTTQGGLKGKIAFMSPEQCLAKAQLDRRSDLYSVGAILYELTTGRPTFVGETEYQILNQIVNEDVPPPSTIVPDYPRELERIVLRALARDPDRRYSTGLELQTDVEDFAHETRLRVSPLVLARLMGTLFPTRLEAWDEAKTQGQFFLEQHVVRTLSESEATADLGDTDMPAPSSDDPAISEHVAEHRIASSGEEEATALASAFTDQGDTTIGEPPLPPEMLADPASAPVALPGEPSTDASDPPAGPAERPSASELLGAAPIVEAPRAPEPAKPASYPMVSELMSAMPGSLTTAVGKYGVPAAPIGKQSDVTERVRVAPRRAPSPTTFVRTSKKTPLVVLLGCVVAAGAIATFIALRPGPAPSAPATTPAVQAEEPPEPAATPVEREETPEPAPVEEQAAVEPVQPAANPVASKPVAKKPVTRVEAKPVAAKKPEPKQITRTEPKKPIVKPRVPAKKKPEPKEKAWNADSPFMPVRTDKK